MEQEPMTLYKLIVLYMVNRVDFPLTRAQVDTFILDREYTTYLTLQQAMSELLEINLIATNTIRNRTMLSLTEEGKQTLTLLSNQLPDAIKHDIDEYLRENSLELRNETSVTADYKKLAHKGYEITLKAMERDDLLMELKLSMPDEKSASKICNQWQKKNEDIYALIMKELM